MMDTEGTGPKALTREGGSLPDRWRNQRGSLRQTLLLLLLLIALGGAALYHFYPDLFSPAPPPPQPQPVKRQPIKLPVAAAQEPAASAQPSTPAQPVPPAASQASPAIPKAEGPEPGVLTEVLPPQPAPALKSSPAPAPPPAAPVKAAPPAPEPAPAAAVKGVQGGEKAAPRPAAPAAVAGPYVLQAGAYIVEANLQEVEATVRKLGFQPRLTRTKKGVDMTRLRVGVYKEQEAKAKVRDLSSLAPDAFYVQKKEGWVVYAGSYHSLDRARSYADRLYAKGVRVEEETARVELPMTIVYFGDFVDAAAAEKTALRARASGLDVSVVKQR